MSDQEAVDTAASTPRAGSRSSWPFVVEEKRQIRFNEKPTIIALIPKLSELSDEELKDVWWDHDDYDHFKLTTRAICKEIRRYESQTSGLNAAYLRARHGANSFQRAKRRSPNQFNDDDDIEPVVERLGKTDTGLVQWCTHGQLRRGLEKWGSKAHIARSKDSRVQKNAIIESELRGDDLRKISLVQSQPSRIFARLMGEADSVAATTENIRRWSGPPVGRMPPHLPPRMSSEFRSNSLPQLGLVRNAL
mmetsp:Transcript_13595/g.20547  ORF Transcript_13595/g.20547 Transcript_13595/m.20547 type:complete len:249 (-) Transcript_13595:316-1062(-)